MPPKAPYPLLTETSLNAGLPTVISPALSKK